MQRPVALTILACLNILLGVLMLVVAVRTILFLASHGAIAEGLVTGDAALLGIWLVVNRCLQAIASAVLVVSGIGLLSLKSWARMSAIGWAVYVIAVSVIGLVLVNTIDPAPLVGVLRERIADGAPGTELRSTLAPTNRVLILRLFYPVVVIGMMFHRRVREAFAQSDPQELGETFPGDKTPPPWDK